MDRVLDAMADGIPALADSRRQWVGEEATFLATVARGDRADVARDGAIFAAICGRPRWTVAEDARVVAGRGHAHALIHAYRRHGRALFDGLHGSFALALFDGDRNSLLLAIDRHGIEPLCYAEQGGALLFATSTQSLRRHPAGRATITPQGIYDYLHAYLVHSPRTIYREQRKLLPGQYLLFRNGRARTESYWRMQYAEDGPADETALGAELRELLEQAVARAVDGAPAHEVGAFLSGGLDSSTVSGYLSRLVAPARTFTIGFEVEKFDESGFARIAADHFGTDHHEYFVTPADVADLLPRLAEVFDEPFGNSSVVPTYFCARMAAESGTRVMLAGDGGDEIFAGNERYLYMTRYDIYGRLPKPLRRGLIEPLLFGLPGADSLPLVAKARRFVKRYRTPLPERLYVYDLVATSDVADMFAADLVPEIDPGSVVDLANEVYWRPESGSAIQRMMHLDLQMILADNDLRKVNRMCQLAGVEVRYPMLDDDLVDFSGRVPTRLLVAGGVLRGFFKRALRDFLPREVVAKKKHGFGLPFQHWLKNDRRLKDMVEDNLSSFAGRNFLRRDFVERVRTSHRHPEVSSLDGLAWDIMVLELWLQRFAGEAG